MALTFARALNNRGIIRGRIGDTEGALADYNAVVDLEGAPLARQPMRYTTEG